MNDPIPAYTITIEPHGPLATAIVDREAAIEIARELKRAGHLVTAVTNGREMIKGHALEQALADAEPALFVGFPR